MNEESAGRRAAVPFRASCKRGRAQRGRRIGTAAGLALPACVLAATHPAAAPAATARPAATAPFVYVADKGRNEISQFSSLGSGALRSLTPKTVASGSFPYAIAVTPQGNRAYAIDEGSNSHPVNEISQYTINPATGKLSPQSPRTVTTAGGPIAIAFTPDGKNAYVANNTGNVISQYSISPATGKLTPKSPRTVASPGGPNSIKVAPDGNYAYVTNANVGTTGADTISAFRISPATGALSSGPVSTLATGHNPQAVAIAPDGKSAYVTNTMDDTISQYSINPASGKLTPKTPATVAAGRGPHDIAVTPKGKNLYVINVRDDTIAQYAINPRTGALSARPVSTAGTVLHPEAIAIAPDGKNVYVTSENDGAISQYAISPTTGKITPLSPATVTTPPSGSLGLAVAPDADLSAKASAPATARHGQALTYTIKITNGGPSGAWEAAVTDHLPAGTAFRSAATAGGRCSHPRSGTRGAAVTCHLATLKAGAAWRIQIKVTVKTSTGTIRDKATITSVTPDPRTSNNTATAATKVTK
jgi:6-phosphogluconolactonase